MVRSTITSFADERMQVISQQIMTRAILMGLVDKYGLYAKKRRHETSEDILERMRKDIKLNPVTADVTDRRSGSRISATIAFTLSYDGENPAATQKVASELVSLYLDENLKNRRNKAAETSSFLSDASIKLSQDLAAIETKVAEFKEKNIGRLPELSQLNMQLRDRTDSELMALDQKLVSLEERKIYLQAELAKIEPNSASGGVAGEPTLGPVARLRFLKVRYATQSGVYSPDHPDMVRMRQEIEGLQRVVGKNGSGDGKIGAQMVKLQADLAAALQKYSSSHPDVVRLKKAILALEESGKDAINEDKLTLASDSAPDNPLYLTFQAQLHSVTNELEGQNKLRKNLIEKLESYERRLLETPQVEREYLDLARAHDNALVKYKEIREKELEAQVAQELEKDRKGERFSLIEPPEYPEKPHSPNRLAILLLSFVLALGGALGFASVQESLDDTIRDAKMLSAKVAAPVLATIPYTENIREKARNTLKKRARLAASLAILVGGAIIIHIYFMPLDVLWYVLARKLTWV